MYLDHLQKTEHPMKLLRNALLETFVTVADCGGFSEAQYALGITQSAISIRIRDLEASLGYRLCDRGRGGFRLTERCETVYRRARSMLRSARDFDAGLMELRGTVTGDLRIGVADAVSSLPCLNLTQALQRFGARPNDVQLDITVASPAELTQQLITGALHVAIAPFRNQIADLEYEDLCQEEHRLYCGAGHPLFTLQGQEAAPQDIAQYPLCQRSYDRLPIAGLAAGEPAASAANMEALAMLIATGQYLGPLPAHFADAWVRGGRLREVNGPELRWVTAFHLATRRGQMHRRAISLFAEDVRRSCQPPPAAPGPG